MTTDRHHHHGRRTFLGLTAGAAVLTGQTITTRALAAPGRPPRGAAAGFSGTVVRASSYGFDPGDSTTALQTALDDPAVDVVIIDRQASDWVTGPLRINRDHLTIHVEPGVTVRAKEGAYQDRGATLLTINGRTGITVSGYQARFQMNKQEYIAIGDGSQWRHAINVGSSVDVVIEGLAIAGAGGDGVYVGRVQSPDYLAESRDVVLRDLLCDDNFRNALSVVSVDGLLVDGCRFVNTEPQNPAAGIDLEPNKPDERLQRIVIRDCLLSGNDRFGFLVARALHTDSPNPIDVQVERIAVRGGAADFGRFTYYAPRNGADSGGSISLADCFLEAAPYAGAFVFVAKPAAGTAVDFTNVVAHSLGAVEGKYEPIALLALDVVDHGGIGWHDVLLRTDVTGPVFAVQKERGPGAGLREITGSITIESPTEPIMDYGANPAGAEWDVTHVATLARPDVHVHAPTRTVAAGDTAVLRFTRTGSTSAPLAVHYEITGQARERVDYQGSAGTVIIPAGSDTVDLRLRTRCRGDRRARPAMVTVAADPHYRTVGSRAVFVVQHSGCGADD